MTGRSTEELLNLGYRLVKQDNIMVNRDGDVWKRAIGNMWIKASFFTDKQNYIKFNVKIDDKYRQIYLHHIVAEAFVPNPKGYKNVLFKDGNREHVCVDNLCWGNGAVGKRKKKYGCSICGSTEEMRCKPFICSSCKTKQKEEERRRKNAEKAQKELIDIDTQQLKVRQREVYDLYIEGKTCSEIAKELGISKQSVNGRLKRIKTKAISAAEAAPKLDTG